MGKCISKCFMIYHKKKSVNSQHTIGTQTSARLELEELNIENQAKQYFPSYDGSRSIQWKDIMHLLEKELYKYKDKHNKFSNEYLIEMLKRFEKYYFRKDDMLELLNIVIQIVQKTKHQNNKNKQAQQQNTINNRQQIKFISEKLYHFQQSLITNHKASIQQLKFICQHQTLKQHQIKEHQHHHKQHFHPLKWSDLNFDLSEKQIQTVAITVRALSQNDINSFAFLTLYFQIAMGKKVRQVKSKKLEQIYVEILEKLTQRYPAKDVLLFNELQPKQKLKQITNLSIEPIEFRFEKTPILHYEQLRLFMVQKSIETKKDRAQIIQILRNILSESDCEAQFLQNKVWEQESQTHSNQTIIKMIENQDIFKDKFVELKQIINENYQRFSKSSVFTIQKLTKLENQIIYKMLVDFLQNKQKVKIHLNETIKLKCLFYSIESMIKVTNQFISIADKNDFQVLSLENRLNFIEKDIKLTIKLTNSIFTIRMVLKLQSISNEFNKKLVSLKNGYYPFSHLSQMYRLSEFQANMFFSELFERYSHISNNLSQSNAQQIAQLSAQIDSFRIKYLNFLNIKIQNIHYQNFSEIGQIIPLLKEIKNCLKSQKSKFKYVKVNQSHIKQQKINQILLSYGMKDFTKAKQLIFKSQKQKIQNNKLLLQILGDIYMALGNNDQSFTYYQNCQKLFFQKGLTQTSQYAQLLEKIAFTHQLKGNDKKSLQGYQISLLIKQKIYEPGSLKCASTLTKIGNLYEKQQLYYQSAKFYKLALKIHSQLFDEKSVEYAHILKSLGVVSQIRKHHEKAIKCIEECLKLYEIFCGNQSLNCAETLDDLGVSYLFKADYEKALQCYSRSLQIKQRVTGKNSINCASSLSGIGSVHEKKDEYDLAIKCYKQSLQIIELCYGKQSIQSVKYLNKIIVVFYHEEKYEQALAYGSKCLQIQQKQKGKQSIDCSGTLFGMSLAYEKLGMKHEAYSVCRRAYRIRKNVLGNEHSLTQQAFNRGEFLIERQNENCLRDVFTL